MGQVVEVKVQRQVPQGIPEPPDGIAGIGIAFASDEDGNFSIHSLHPQGSAAACGQLDPGDFLVAVEGNPVAGLDIPGVVSRIKGPIGTFVTLNIVKGDGQALYVDDNLINSKSGNSSKKQPPSTGMSKPLQQAGLPAMEAPPEQTKSGAGWTPSQWKGQEEAAETGEGYGVWDYPDGKVYRGEMKGGKREGYGTITYTDGATYMGDWKADNRHGQGEYKYANGAWYRGGWAKGNRQGRGVCTFEDGNLYEGEWENNLPHGEGRCRFAEGSVYEGAFVGGKMHGWGSLYTHEGNLWFEGEWKNGERVQKKGASGPPPPSRDGPGPKAPQREEVSWGDEVNKIFVTVQGGTRLPELEDGPPCPYIVTSLGPQTHITKTLGPSTEPVWDMEVAEFNLPPVNTRGRTNLHIKLYHWIASQSRLLGEARVPINQLAAFTAKPQECSCSLLRPDGNPLRGKDLQKAEVHILVMLTRTNPLSGGTGPPVSMYKAKGAPSSIYGTQQQPMHFSMNQSLHSTMQSHIGREPVLGSHHNNVTAPSPALSNGYGARGASLGPPSDHVTCSLTIDEDYGRIAADGALNRYKGEIRSAVATALSVPVSRVAVTRLSAGPVIATLQFIGGDDGRSPMQLAEDLVRQASDPRSPLRQTSLLPRAIKCKIVQDGAANHSMARSPQGGGRGDDDLEWQRLQETSMARGYTPTPTYEGGRSYIVSPRGRSPHDPATSVPPYGYGIAASPGAPRVDRAASPVNAYGTRSASPPRYHNVPDSQVLGFRTEYAPQQHGLHQQQRAVAQNAQRLNPADWQEMPYDKRRDSSKSIDSIGGSVIGDALDSVAKALGGGLSPRSKQQSRRESAAVSSVHDSRRESFAQEYRRESTASRSVAAPSLATSSTFNIQYYQQQQQQSMSRRDSAISNLHSSTGGHASSSNYVPGTNYASEVPRVIETQVHHETRDVNGAGGGSGLYQQPQQYVSSAKHYVDDGQVSGARQVHEVLGSSARPVGRHDDNASGLRISHSSTSPQNRPLSSGSAVSSGGGSGRCGVGLKLKSSGGRIVVDKIQKDSAADMDARLVPGDVIIAVDGQQLETLQMAKDLVIGAEGTPVVIEVGRSNLPFPLKVTLTRRSLHIDRGNKASHSHQRPDSTDYGPLRIFQQH